MSSNPQVSTRTIYERDSEEGISQARRSANKAIESIVFCERDDFPVYVLQGLSTRSWVIRNGTKAPSQMGRVWKGKW
ncbi:hypothetical protein AGABI1DRAFT_87480 [Agaricus bisporus var. burnettii JB137-S8]|uniref:Uncharacterized protein n=1 Tax=Agaricus bisporus var. burnettii (strain JB137-S8 / ATCC MYA-4627 / FGSC 10392) TaxID=597362 RepID=K5XMX5_AGABU|nr:uncharacterized protein AGABI1DRAFT_87480 [Agaricus bisporus var. burnettii JB137-S8]EKM75970.1 hypothetical protein AGABI1DRAFT_87480 [Agaricus bisporus var. burnettii JB137-S8]